MSLAHALYANLIEDLDRSRGNRGLLYFPMKAGGEKFGLPLELTFSSRTRTVPYLKMPVWYERREKKVVEPTADEYRSKMMSVRSRTEGGAEPLHFIWDDVISEGKGTMTFFYWLMRRGVRPENIAIGSMLDNVGITRGLCIARYYFPAEPYKSIDPLQILRELKNKGDILEDPDVQIERRPASPAMPIIVQDEQPEEIGGILETLMEKISKPRGGEAVRAVVKEKYGV